MIISPYSLNARANQEFAKLNFENTTVIPFSWSELIMDPSKHFLSSGYTHYTKKQTEDKLAELNANPLQLAIYRKNDIVVKTKLWEGNRIVQCTRPNYYMPRLLSTVTYQYRYIYDPPRKIIAKTKIESFSKSKESAKTTRTTRKS